MDTQQLIRPIRSGPALLGAFASALTLCNPLAGQNPVVRDSAGVRIVENPARMRAPVTFRLGTTPVLDFGGPDESKPDNEFAANQGYLRGVRLSDNGLAAIDVVRVQYFDARGKRVRIAGRSGSGPEEFLYLTSVCRTRGDTIMVSDSRNGRLGILDQNGAIVRTVKQSELGSPPFDGCFDDGTVLLAHYAPMAPGAIRSTRLTRVRLDGSVVNTIGDFSFAPFESVTQSEPAVIASGQRVYIGDPRFSEIRVYSADGKLTSIIRSADPPVRITDAQREERMRSSIPRDVSATEVTARMARMRSLPRPANWPAYRRVYVDPRGTLGFRITTSRSPHRTAGPRSMPMAG
ncbi:MAG: hypothetical protein ACRENP_22345 [Longimicrobiales bacterium]